eukprot:TRINITY_DN17302_c0_g1_i2.p1 TRINITY_DN17302_c0_g1~~TRINITY_DN17302_c0_g1_i2.p1  ORF type:complete len:307 (+),score=55.10 TRINITY_DN17302_c0_g1_i2:61-921(+)
MCIRDSKGTGEVVNSKTSLFSRNIHGPEPTFSERASLLARRSKVKVNYRSPEFLEENKERMIMLKERHDFFDPRKAKESLLDLYSPNYEKKKKDHRRNAKRKLSHVEDQANNDADDVPFDVEAKMNEFQRLQTMKKLAELLVNKIEINQGPMKYEIAKEERRNKLFSLGILESDLVNFGEKYGKEAELVKTLGDVRMIRKIPSNENLEKVEVKAKEQIRSRSLGKLRKPSILMHRGSITQSTQANSEFGGNPTNSETFDKTLSAYNRKAYSGAKTDRVFTHFVQSR